MACPQQAHEAAPSSGIKASLNALEEQIRCAAAADRSLSQNHAWLISVPGIGQLTAVYLLCGTSNFALRPRGKQLACYAGGVPFPHASGTSIKGKDRRHKMVNKELKRLLHLGALSAVKNDPEFKEYYERKCREGKHASSLLNAIPNKITLPFRL